MSEAYWDTVVDEVIAGNCLVDTARKCVQECMALNKALMIAAGYAATMERVTGFGSHTPDELMAMWKEESKQ